MSEILKTKGYKKIFILSGEQSFKFSKAKNFFKKIFKEKLTKVFFKKFKNPKILELNIILKSINSFNPDLIFAIGGGSVIDYAKLTSNIIGRKKANITKLKNKFFLKKKVPVWAFPTTAGSGAEATEFSVIYSGNKKFSIKKKTMLPDKYFHIPELAMNSKKHIRSASALDSISQALESSFSRSSNKLSFQYSLKSLELSLKYIRSYLLKPDKQNTKKMLYAAYLSGKAINIAKTNGPHALSYFFSEKYLLNHGHAVFLTTPEFIFFNYNNLKKSKCDFDLKNRYDHIFKIFKVKNIYELYNQLIYLRKLAKLEFDFKKLNIDIKKIRKKVVLSVNKERLKNNPIDISSEDIYKILERNFF